MKDESRTNASQKYDNLKANISLAVIYLQNNVNILNFSIMAHCLPNAVINTRMHLIIALLTHEKQHHF